MVLALRSTLFKAFSLRSNFLALSLLSDQSKEHSLPRIYTKTGDDGTTGLIGGKRVSKDCARIGASGSVDELNAVIGVVRSYQLPGRVDKVLQRIQDNLFLVGAELAIPEGRGESISDILPLREKDVRFLEKEIDICEENLMPLDQFILPGGASAGAMLHMARAVARRAERHLVRLSRAEKINPQLLRYLNRLSDLFFVLARSVNKLQSQQESHPTLRKVRN